MAQNNLDMQTFQIYQDEETVPVAVDVEQQPKKKRFSMSNFKRNAIKNKVKAKSSSQNGDSMKGILIGAGILILFIVLDQMKLF